MVSSIKDRIADSGALTHVAISSEIDLLLSGLEIAEGPVDQGDDIITGKVILKTDLSKSPIPGFDFGLSLPPVVKAAPFKLKTAADSFQFWLVLAEQEQVYFIFKFLDGVPGLILTPAKKVVAADGSVTLEALPDDSDAPLHLACKGDEAGDTLGPALLVAGSTTESVSMRFTPDTESTKGVVALGLEPSTVVFGASGIGFDCPSIILDDSEEAKGPGHGAPGLDPLLAAITADEPAWRGLLARELDFYLPANVPMFGGRPIKGYFAMPSRQGGVELVVETQVPASPATPTSPRRLGYSLRIECIDPTARGLSGLLPTLIRGTMELPLDGVEGDFPGGRDGVQFAAGKPVLLTATFARDPVNAPSVLGISLGISSQGPNGVISVTSDSMGGAKIFNTAAALATALIADKNVDHKADVGGMPGVMLSALLAAGAGLSSLFTDDSSFVLHGAEIESFGRSAPVGGPVVVTLDYSVAARITKIGVEALSVEMKPDQPMLMRLRKVRMSVDPSKGGLDMIGLDFGYAEMEIENPGAWTLEGLKPLFDVLRSRSGRGSAWMEVDLGFKLNLGPIKVSEATIRAIYDNNSGLSASIRGLKAAVTIPAALEAEGGVCLLTNRFAADLAATVIPLKVTADASIEYNPPEVLLQLGVTLPAPIPLANSGFGLFGIGGLIGFSTVPNYGEDPDPVLRQLKWDPRLSDSFKPASGVSTFGFAAVVGTLPDLGFSFSAKASLIISIPDIALRGGLNGRVLQPPVTMKDRADEISPGISFIGFLSVDSKALDFGLLGDVDLRPLLQVSVPFTGHFPFVNISDWYLYLGADGAQEQGREIGPITAQILPDILNAKADAYFMLRGRGIANWPYGRQLPNGPLTLSDGFVIAFGFAIQEVFGVKPVVWAELHASLDLLVGAKPPTLAGFGAAGGSLNLGPFGLGVEAQVSFLAQKDILYLWAQVTGRIELLFFDIEGTVTISFGDKPDLTLPPPDLHPLDRLDASGNRAGTLGSLTDDSYRVLAPLVEDYTLITGDMTVWPDAIISLPFVIAPEIGSGAAAQFPGVSNAPPAPARIGSEMLRYTWRLDKVELRDVTDEADKITGAGKAPPGPLIARWQVPRGVIGSDITELVLLSESADIWVNRLADGGEGLPSKPLQQAADICHWQVTPQTGWAIGFLAGLAMDGLNLPSDPVSLDPLMSRVEVRFHHFGINLRRLVTPLDGAFALPPPFSVEPAQIVAWPKGEEIKHEFEGHLVAPNLHWFDGLQFSELKQAAGSVFAGQEILLELVEAITGGMLLLVVRPEVLKIQEDFVGIRVFDDKGVEWQNPGLIVIPTGETAALYYAPGSDPVSRLRVTYPIGEKLGVVGVGGITNSARSEADRQNKASADEAKRLAEALAAGPQVDKDDGAPHQRVILDPDRLYRIDIDTRWAGMLFQQDEAGQVQLAASVSYDDQPDVTGFYDPKGGPDHSTNQRHLFFRTTPRPPAKQPPVKYGSDHYLPWLLQRQDNFHPEMLQRYLAGYEPAQSEQFRFCDDPLRAHFTQDHAAALAKAYGLDLQVAVRRVDRPGAAYANPMLIMPNWSFLTNPSFLSPVDQIRFDYAAHSACALPTPGATATVTTPLDPRAWYDIHVEATAKETGVDGGKLPGVTFRTSRWRNPAEMLAALGLNTPVGAAVPITSGDLSVNDPAGIGAPVLKGDDQGFQQALSALGLENWQVAEEPRLSRLWTAKPGGGWLFAGLMLESPEPIHRPGRLEVMGLMLSAGPGFSGSFDLRWSDQVGARLIYLAAAPFDLVASRLPRPGSPPFLAAPTLMLTCTDRLAGGALQGTLALPLLPGFSEDP